MVLPIGMVREAKNMSLTVCMTTSRPEPEFKWLYDSLKNQCDINDVKILIISLHAPRTSNSVIVDHAIFPPKPNIWQGDYRLTKENWWAVSNARNTALCLCKTDWILFLDDRCVLQPGFMDAVREAMAGKYIMAGSYEKRQGMTVENGVIKHGGIIQAHDPRSPYFGGQDHRIDVSAGKVVDCQGSWLFGCCLLMPLEWALAANGYPERCDSLSFEDCIFGVILQNNKFPMKFDPRAKIVEDRTPDKLGTPMKRSSKEHHPNDKTDKAHTSLKWVATAIRSDNGYDIRALRDTIQKGGEFPIPNNPEARDWFDRELVRDFK